MLHNALRAFLTNSYRSCARYKSLRSLSTKSLVSSLDPCRLKPSDFRSLAGKASTSIRHKESDDFSRIYFKLKSESGVLIRIPFPQNAHGFLYFHRGPVHAPIAGGVRFRVVPSKDPEKFDCGHDLLSHNLCLPWSIPLPTILVRQTYAAFASVLLEHDNLALLVSTITTGLKEEEILRTKASVTMVHSLGQHLYADVSKTHVYYRIAKGEILDSRFHFRPFTDPRGEDRHAPQHAPYTGSFPHSNSTQHSHSKY
jgi:hypothetical protein